MEEALLAFQGPLLRQKKVGNEVVKETVTQAGEMLCKRGDMTSIPRTNEARRRGLLDLKVDSVSWMGQTTVKPLRPRNI